MEFTVLIPPGKQRFQLIGKQEKFIYLKSVVSTYYSPTMSKNWLSSLRASTLLKQFIPFDTEVLGLAHIVTNSARE